VVLGWAGASLARPFARRPRPIHLLFCLVDHYEPGTGGVDREVERARTHELLERFPRLVEGHQDASGVLPKRTWFFPPHYHRYGTLKRLVSLCERGYGEIELHLHHGKDRPDSAENLRRTLERCVDEYSRFGIFGTEDGRKRYGFIHGDWALDNSRDGRYCGVNNELKVLRETGCYADFTFPSLNESNPAQLNSIYYATDDPDRPKSHDRGSPVRAANTERGDLMIVQGPIFPFRKGRSPLRLWIFGDVIDGRRRVSPARVDAWVRASIHVEGRPDWIFVKTHTHGATDAAAVLGEEMDEIYRYLETRYNDGRDWVLHYVTARELYNVCKAIEAGEPGNDPSAYRDYRIRPPIYDPSPDVLEASTALRKLIAKTYSG
jgi:hypothetical protein